MADITNQPQQDTPTEDLDRNPSHFQAGPGLPATGRKDLVNVPVPVDALEPLSDEEEDTSGSGVKGAVTGALGMVKRLRGDKKTALGKVKVLEMTREEYNKYWAKDEAGNYCGTEPEGEGRRLWADQLKE